MFSARLPSLEHNQITRSLDSLREQGQPLLDLTDSNPTAVGLVYPEQGILAALADPRSLRYQPSPRGLEEAREAVAAYYRRRDLDVDAERVWLTASTSEAYSFLFKLLCNPGEKVLVPRPSYPLFEHLSMLDGVRAVSYPLRYHAGWFVDLDEVRALVDFDTRAILLVNPNNPTGSFVKGDELQALVQMARGRDIALISDEVFGDYAFGDDAARAASLAGHADVLTFVLSGLSKPAGLPQVKLGWIHACGPERLVAQAAARLDLITDTYLSVGSPVQWASPRLFDLVDEMGGQIRARTRANRAQARALVRDSAVQLLDCEGGWSAVLRLPRTHTEEEWVLSFLENDGVIVHPGFFFDFEEDAYVVVSLLVPEADFTSALRKIVARVNAG
jgi:aspartate/methionine/tyrosine aminotransferase